MKKIALVLSGCGHRDGSEITETVSSIIALSQAGAHVEFFAPNLVIDSFNHHTSKVVDGEKRNMLHESARITRGRSIDIINLKPQDFDALIFVGGVGAATNLSNWNAKGAGCTVINEVSRAIEAFYSQSKPIGAICIAPVLLARVLGQHHISITIGDDQETIQEIEKTGARHVLCSSSDLVVDKTHKIVTTPAYMLEAPPHKIFKGISGLASEIVKMA